MKKQRGKHGEKPTLTHFSIPLTLEVVEVTKAQFLSPDDSCDHRWFVQFSFPIPKSFEAETLAIATAKAAVITRHQQEQQALLESLRTKLRKAGETGISSIIRDTSEQQEAGRRIFEENLTGRMALEDFPWLPCRAVVVELPKNTKRR